MQRPVTTGPAPARRWRGAALAGAAALTFLGWLGWDETYAVDPVTGASSGPYEAWQVLGAVVTLAVLAGLGARWAGVPRTVTGLALGFTLAWSLVLAPRDSSGLWIVGALLVLVGVALLATLVAGTTARVLGRRVNRPQGGG